MRSTVQMFVSLSCLAGLFLLNSPAPAANEPAPNTLTDKQKADGWKLLFDGKTTKGWHKYKGKDVGDQWKAVDGALTLAHKSGKNGGDIVTDDMFDSFELAIEWK